MEPPAIGPSVKRQEKKVSLQNMMTASGLTTKRDAFGITVRLQIEDSRKEKAKEKASKERREKAAKEVKDEDS